MRKARCFLASLLSLALGYFFGIYFPTEPNALNIIKNSMQYASSNDVTRHRITAPIDTKVDSVGRLIWSMEKIVSPCPEQTQHTAVLLLMGQSNAGNHAGQKFSSEFGGHVLNFSGTHCYLAESPLLGSTGMQGESWTLLGNKLIANGHFKDVILVPVAVSGSAISQWQEGGALQLVLEKAISDIHSKYSITHVIWHQGEADFLVGTAKEDYEQRFRSLHRSMRNKGVFAPVFISVATNCKSTRSWSPDNQVALAQRTIPDSIEGVFAGVDTDAILGNLDRYDDCHFSASGQQKFSDAWLKYIH